MKSKGAKYRKTMNTIGRVGGLAGKLALGAAVYSNPAIAGTVLGSMATKKIAKFAEQRADKYFKGKTGTAARIYRSGRDITNAALNYTSGDLIGAASDSARLIADTGFLSKNAERKYRTTSNNYIQPTLRAAGAAKIGQQIYKNQAAKQKVA
jgi:hypothetical protein